MNGKLIKMPKLFEFKYISDISKSVNCLLLDLNINSNKIATKLQFNSLWNLKKDYYEIEIPFICNNLKNVNLNTTLSFNNEIIFTYSTNDTVSKNILKIGIFVFFMILLSNMNYFQTKSGYDEQEFYSSVTVNPVLIPLK